MFISLVFEWNDIFRAMFVRVIIKYDPKGLSGAKQQRATGRFSRLETGPMPCSI
jgi:hypothetical protein